MPSEAASQESAAWSRAEARRCRGKADACVEAMAELVAHGADGAVIRARFGDTVTGLIRSGLADELCAEQGHLSQAELAVAEQLLPAWDGQSLCELVDVVRAVAR